MGEPTPPLLRGTTRSRDLSARIWFVDDGTTRRYPKYRKPCGHWYLVYNSLRVHRSLYSLIHARVQKISKIV